MNGPFAFPGSGPVHRFEQREAQGWLPRGWIDGLTLSNDGTDATNDIGIAAGVARSTVNIIDGAASTLTRDQVDLELPVAIIKQLDVAFAPDNYDPDGYSGGDRSGGRSSSAISDTTWHAILAGGAGLKPDVFLHDAATQASILAEMQKTGGYSAYRRIGSIIRSTSIRPFIQLGDDFDWVTPTLDVNNATPGTTTNTGTLTVPTGVSVMARVNISAATAQGIYVSALDQTDSAMSYSAAPLGTIGDGSNASASGPLPVRTNTSGQIRYRANANSQLYIVTVGWRDQRGKNA